LPDQQLRHKPGAPNIVDVHYLRNLRN